MNLCMKYKNVALLSYSVEPSKLTNLIPKGLELDLFDNKAIVTINTFKIIAKKNKRNSHCFKRQPIQFHVLVSVRASNQKGFFAIFSYSNSWVDSIASTLIFKSKCKFKKIDLILKNNLFSLIERGFFRKKKQTLISWKKKQISFEKSIFNEFLCNRHYFFIKKNKHILKSKFCITSTKPYEMLIINTPLPILTDALPLVFKEPVYIKRMEVALDPFKPVITPILFFDGKCGFCNAVLRLILNLDKERIIKIAPNDGMTANCLIDVLRAQDRIILLDDLGISEGALAFLRILDYLPKIKVFFYPLRLLPLSFLNFCYDRVAKYRSKCNLKLKPIEDDRLLP
jgi:predicted DCC family thiol-disulfide oxidoreductase YuxK